MNSEKKKNRQTQTGLEIAIIGMSGRFPGAPDLAVFWENLKNGVESLTFFTREELLESGLTAAEIDDPDFVPASGGLLEDSFHFDASFFGFLPAEARVMDPQIRLFHECAWHALEDGGYGPASYPGSIGVYAGGLVNQGWGIAAFMSEQGEGLSHMDVLNLSNKDFICTFLSYKLNLRGPSVAVQTACSTSLVAVHLACRALMTRECDMALAGGSTVRQISRPGYMYEEGMIYSADGHVRAFDAAASGSVAGSGVGLVLLKRLKAALEEGDRIYAVIKGTAINNDGVRKAGYTAPSVEGQADVAKMAQRISRVPAESISYIEAHGTGTVIGDPIEFEGLKLAFNTGKRNFCALGSVKTNIGHLDSAAGVAGLIKTALALEHRRIPPGFHFEAPNPRIDLEKSPFFVNRELHEWVPPEAGYPLRAGVNSFGIGGTNAHAILEEAPPPRPVSAGRDLHTIMLSAKTPTALETMSQNLAAHMKANPGLSLADAAYTLQVGRDVLDFRRVAVASGLDDAAAALQDPASERVQTFGTKKKNLFTVFMFPGQGAQYVNMARGLYEKEPLFREEMERCFDITASLNAGAPNLKGVLFPPSRGTGDAAAGAVKQTATAQPLLFMIHYSLARLLMAWGISPDAMIGHSIGEYAAACLAGVFSLEDALRTVTARGRLMQDMPAGAMLGVPLPEDEVKAMLSPELSLAALNGPSRCVVSGTFEAVGQLARELEEKGVQARKLHTSHAFHSAMMEPILEPFRREVEAVKLNPPEIPFVSNVTGAYITPQEAADPGYWVQHIRRAVRFGDGLSQLLKKDNLLLVEVGPGNVLSTFARVHKDKKDTHHIVNLMRRPREDVSDHVALYQKLGLIWLFGKSPDWKAFYKDETRNRVPLPLYPFERKEFYLDTDIDTLLQGTGGGAASMGKITEVAQWFHLPSWKRVPFISLPQRGTEPGSEPGARNYLLFADNTGIAETMSAQLRAQGHTVVLVLRGNGFETAGDGTYAVDPAGAGDYVRLAQELKETGRLPHHIVHLWNVNANVPDRGCEHPDMESFSRAQDPGFYSLINIARSFQEVRHLEPMDILAVSTGLFEVDGTEPLAPSRATLLSPLKTIPQEYAHIRCRCADITAPGNEVPPSLARRLLAEFTAPLSHKIVAYRGNFRWIRTYEPLDLGKAPEKPALLKEKGVYVIIGGLGNIGLVLARFLAETFGARLVLAGRSSFPPPEAWDQHLEQYKDKAEPGAVIAGKIREIRAMEAAGAEVWVTGADVADKERMRELLETAEKRWGAVNGIFHSAAGLERQPVSIAELEKDSCRQRFHAKVTGLLVLRELLEEEYRSVDFCLVMSSLSCVLGGLGTTPYAAAKNFMDAFTTLCNREDRTLWLAPNWDGWKFRDEAPGTSTDALTMTPAEGTIAFRYLLSRVHEPLARAVISTGPLDPRLEQWVYLGTAAAEDEAKDGQPPELMPRPFLTKPYAPPRNPLEKELTGLWQNFFGIGKLGIHDDFFELGGDSLKGMTLVNRYKKLLGENVSIQALFEAPTIAELSAFFAENYPSTVAGINGDSAPAPQTGGETPLEAVEKKEYYPVSSAQLRMFVLQQMDKDQVNYNLPYVFYVDKSFDTQQLEEAFRELIRRHETLRTSFHQMGEEPVQRVHDHVPFALEHLGLPAGNGSESMEERIEAGVRQAVRPFDLGRAPLMRVVLMEVPGDRDILVFDMHHIVKDGTSQEIIGRELSELLSGASLPPLRIQYKDYCHWMHSPGHRTMRKSQEAFWLETFSGETPVLQLPLDYRRPPIQGYDGGSVEFILDSGETAALKGAARGTGTTMFMLAFSLYNLLTAKLSGQEDIVTGIPTAGRRHPDLEPIVGMFVNTLALRTYPSGDKTFRQYLGEVKQHTLQAFENQEYPFDDLVEHLTVQRDLSRNPLFDMMFVLQNIGDAGSGEREAEPGDGDAKISRYHFQKKVSNFDMSWYLNYLDGGERMHVNIEYAAALFKEESIHRFARYFRRLVSAALENTDAMISALSLLSAEEKRQVLETFNRGPEYPADKTIHQLFRRQVERTPHAAAVVEGEQVLTFLELDRRGGRLAQQLLRHNPSPGMVGIMAYRSLEMMIGLLGILKSGSAYVPLNPRAPHARNTYILDQCAAGTVLITAGVDETLFEGREVVFLEDSRLPLTGQTEPLPSAQNHGADGFAYVMFTSGSTGQPKGVPITHANFCPLMYWGKQLLSFRATDRALQNLSYFFDWSVWEMFIALTGGVSLYMFPDEVLLEPAACIGAIRKQDITVLHATPSQYRYFLDTGDKLETLRYLVLGAEKLTPDILERSFQSVGEGCRMFNMYGPTEATIMAAVKEIPPEERYAFENSGTVSIGTPVAGLRLFVLDRHLEPCPVNTAGELYIAGPGVASGYLNDSTLTAERFNTPLSHLPSPLSTYRTGDLARRLEDGTLEFVGRMDQQVKVRGFRIELGEIENRLLEHPGIKDTVIITRETPQGEAFICAYVIPGTAEETEAETQWRDFLGKYLPDYMVPAHFVTMEAFPLAPNGKVDPRALPEPEAGDLAAYVAPTGEVEETLASVWSGILGIPAGKIGVTDNFFHRGGHSLKATLMAARIEKRFGVNIPLGEIMRTPTIRQIASLLGVLDWAHGAEDEPGGDAEEFEI